MRGEVGAIGTSARAFANQSKANTAEGLAKRAEEMSRKLAGNVTETAAAISSHCDLADFLYQIGRSLQAENTYDRCLKKANALWDRGKNETTRNILVRALIDFGMIIRLQKSRIAEAEALHVRSVELTRELVNDAWSNDARLLAVEARVALADTLSCKEQYSSTTRILSYAEAHEIMKNTLDTDSNRRDWTLLSTKILNRISAIR